MVGEAIVQSFHLQNLLHSEYHVCHHCHACRQMDRIWHVDTSALLKKLDEEHSSAWCGDWLFGGQMARATADVLCGAKNIEKLELLKEMGSQIERQSRTCLSGNWCAKA